MNYNIRINCASLSCLKRLQTFLISLVTVLRHTVKIGYLSKKRELSESPSTCILRLPTKLQFRGKKGFTLIEVMMVIAIIGTLAAIAIPNYIGYRQKAQQTKTLQIMRTIERELAIFNIEKGYFPETLAEAGLDHLKDPWGNPFQYLNLQTLDEKGKGKGKVRKDHSLHPLNTDYDLYSMGPDGKSVPPLTGKPSRDDIIRANDGAFLGKGSDY